MDGVSNFQIKSVKIIDHDLLKEESKDERIPTDQNQPPEEEKKAGEQLEVPSPIT